MSHHPTAFLPSLVVTVLLCQIGITSCCYLITQAKAGDHICTFVLEGYDLELLVPRQRFSLQDGTLILMENASDLDITHGMFDLALRVSKETCHWFVTVPVIIIELENRGAPQQYNLWPRCVPGEPRPHHIPGESLSRSKREVTICDDQTDCDLVWTMVYSPYIAVVPWDAPNDACIYTLSAESTSASEVSYHLRSAGTNAIGRFRVDETSGCILTAVSPDESYEALADGSEEDGDYLLSVYARSANEHELNGKVSVFVDHHVPQFSQSVYEATVTENVDSQIVTTVKALSFNIKWAVSYSIKSGLYLDDHTIDSQDGTIRLQRSLDRESDLPYFLIVEASDPNGIGQARVNVVIEDVNDCTPTFNSSTFLIDGIPETYTGIIATFTATDCDEGPNANITYQTDSSEFRLKADGALYAIDGVLDFDRGSGRYPLVIEAVDDGNPRRTGTAYVIVEVIDTNDEAPVFIPSDYSYIIDENIGSNSLDIGSVCAIDVDSGDTLTFDQNQGCPFDIDGTTGVVSFDGSFAITNEEYPCTVTATDSEGQGSDTKFTITVNDINDNQPEFENFPDSALTVSEDATDGDLVIQMTATDADRGLNGEVTYQIEPTDTPFSIGYNTGIITVQRAKDLDREDTASYLLTVIATDRSPSIPQLQGFCEVTIEIGDVNDEYPEFQLQAGDYRTLISTDIGVGESVVEVIAEDPDLNTRITYTMSTNPNFRINQNTGEIICKSTSELQSDTYTVTASDEKLNSSIDITINVGSNPKAAPSWDSITITYPVGSSIPEDTPVGTTVVTISSAGSEEDLLFELLRGARPETNSLDTFDLQNNDDFRSATIRVRALDYETVESVTLQISVQVSGGDSLRAKNELTIAITDVNDEPPTFLQDIYEASVREGLDAEDLPAPVIELTASDLDVTLAFRAVVYSIPDDEPFVIDPNTGEISATESFDREKGRDVYTLNVKATQDTFEVTTTVSIYVLDTNDFSPRILDDAPITISLSEDTSVGTMIEHGIVVEDLDVESILQYFIVDEYEVGGNYERAGTFTIDSTTGNIFLAKSLDYEDIQTYRIKFAVNDGLNDADKFITVNVLDTDDEPPELSVTGVCEVEENIEPPAEICTVNVDEADCPSASCTYEYSIVDGSSEFTINEEGAITSQGPLDREEVATYYLVVSAEDPRGNIGLTEVVIEVLDQNDNAPAFTEAEYVRYIEENTDGAVDSPVTAYDPDEGPQLTYTVNDTDRFTINNSGVLRVRSPTDFDREVTEGIRVEVCASDSVREVCTPVYVSVVDTNDNAPSDLKMIYPVTADTPSIQIEVPETTAVGETVAVFQVSDPDVDFRNNVTFELSPASAPYDIYSDPNTLQGVVTLAQAIDCDVAGSPCDALYSLTVTVTDVGSPSTLAFVIVEVEGDELPVITVQDTLEISESAAVAGATIGVVSACDYDEGGSVSLVIDPSSDRDNIFYLDDVGAIEDCVTKQVKLNSVLDREERAEYTLVFTAESGTGKVSQTVRVVVEDVDDEAPYFADPYTGVINPNNNGQQWIATVSATDDDPASATFTYQLGNNFNGLFRLDLNENNNTATIYKQNGGVPAADEYELTINLSDDASNEGSGTVLVNVYRNVNEHQPDVKTMTVYSFEGSIPSTPIGTVPYSDADAVDDKTFVPAEDLPDQFSLNDQTGMLTIAENTPAGTYTMEFTVRDDRYANSIVTWGDGQTSDVTVIVKSISRAQVENSGSIQFPSVDPLTFVTSYYQAFMEDLSGILSVSEDSIEVFSVLSDGDTGTNVRYSVAGTPGSNNRAKRAASVSALSNGLLTAEYLDAVVLRAVSDGSLSGLQVGMVPVDACTPNPCFSDCTSVLTIDMTPVTINAEETSLVSVNAYESAECSCAVRSTPIGGCLSNTCANGGICSSLVNGDVGYTCECPAGFDGPECQQLVRSFTGGYAWFDTLAQCQESHTSLEVLTTSPDGILLYSGQLVEEDASDFILLELVDGSPKLTLILSEEVGGRLVLTLPQTMQVDDGEWHKIDIYRNETYIEMVVDSCSDLDYTEDHSKSIVQATDTCSVGSAIDTFDSRFDSSRPLQLGGVQRSTDWVYDNAVPATNEFNGCIGNLIQNGDLYDLADTDTYQSSETGCPEMQSACLEGDSACVSGACDVVTSECVCDPGWTGATCTETLPEYDFDEESYVTYELSEAPDPKRSDYYVMIRTRQNSGLIWTIRNDNTYEHITLELVSGYLQARWHLGDTTITDSLPDYPLNNGEWHSISFKRVNNYITIKIDGGGSVRELSNSESKFRELNVDTTSLQVGARLVREVVVLQNMRGCAADVRLNNEYLGMVPETGNSVLTSQGVTEGCYSNACQNNPCQNETAGECVDLWRDYECRTDITSEPLINAILVLSTEAIIAIVSCILFLILMLLIACCWASHLDKSHNKMFLMVDEEPVHEDLSRFDEEGGGEGDDDGYDYTLFRRPLVPGTKPVGEMVQPIEEVVRPVEEAAVEAERVIPVKSAVTFQPSVGDYLHDRVYDEDNRSDNGPPDDTHEYEDEGGESSAGTLSSLNSSSTEASQDFGFLQEYGPPFKRLADMYGTDEEQSDSVRLSYSSTEA